MLVIINSLIEDCSIIDLLIRNAFYLNFDRHVRSSNYKYALLMSNDLQYHLNMIQGTWVMFKQGKGLLVVS